MTAWTFPMAIMLKVSHVLFRHGNPCRRLQCHSFVHLFFGYCSQDVIVMVLKGAASELIFASCGYDILTSGSHTTLDGRLSLKILIARSEEQSSSERFSEEWDINFTDRRGRQVIIYPSFLLCFNHWRAARDHEKSEFFKKCLIIPTLTRKSFSRVASNRERGLEPPFAPLSRCEVRHSDTQLSQRFCGRRSCESLWYTRGLHALLGRS